MLLMTDSLSSCLLVSSENWSEPDMLLRAQVRDMTPCIKDASRNSTSGVGNSSELELGDIEANNIECK